MSNKDNATENIRYSLFCNQFLLCELRKNQIAVKVKKKKKIHYFDDVENGNKFKLKPQLFVNCFCFGIY